MATLTLGYERLLEAGRRHGRRDAADCYEKFVGDVEGETADRFRAAARALRAEQDYLDAADRAAGW